jgi:hypothetical protein
MPGSVTHRPKDRAHIPHRINCIASEGLRLRGPCSRRLSTHFEARRVVNGGWGPFSRGREGCERTEHSPHGARDDRMADPEPDASTRRDPYCTVRGVAIEIGVWRPASRFLSRAGKSRSQPADFRPTEIGLIFLRRLRRLVRHHPTTPTKNAPVQVPRNPTLSGRVSEQRVESE